MSISCHSQFHQAACHWDGLANSPHQSDRHHVHHVPSSVLLLLRNDSYTVAFKHLSCLLKHLCLPAYLYPASCFCLLVYFKNIWSSFSDYIAVQCVADPTVSPWHLKMTPSAESVLVCRPVAGPWFCGWIYCWIPTFEWEALTLPISGGESLCLTTHRL